MKAKEKETLKTNSVAELQDLLAKAKEKKFNLLFKLEAVWVFGLWVIGPARVSSPLDHHRVGH